MRACGGHQLPQGLMYSHVGSHLEQMELLCCQQLDNTNGNGGLLSAHDLHAAWARLGSAEATVKATAEGYAFIKSATILMTPSPPSRNGQDKLRTAMGKPVGIFEVTEFLSPAQGSSESFRSNGAPAAGGMVTAGVRRGAPRWWQCWALVS